MSSINLNDEKTQSFIDWYFKNENGENEESDIQEAIKYDALKLLEEEDYIILDDQEADDMFDNIMDDIIDDTVLSQIPEHLQYYFDTDSYKEDVKISDGRGHIISRYDGNEIEHVYNNTSYYIYRIN